MSKTTGMIATSHPEAVHAGAGVLAEGGNAVDAAVTAALVLSVVEPMSVGLGGDLIAMVWTRGAAAPTGINSIGWSGSRASIGFLASVTGSQRMPTRGPMSVTVPGAVAGLNELLNRFGSIPAGRALEPAISLAVRGHMVTPTIAQMWNDGAARLSSKSRAVFLVDGRPPRAGEQFSNPDLGSFLKTLSHEGLEWFYEEEFAFRLVAAAGAGDGPLTPDDIKEWPGPQTVVPLRGSFLGHDVFEMPPPGQGVSVLEALALHDLSGLPEEHALIECVKLALEDAGRYVCDPNFGEDASGKLLDSAFLERRVGEFSRDSVRSTPTPGGSDTVYVAAVDGNGMACSLIQSLYESFGSGIVVPGTGLLLHNRAQCFQVDPAHPNALEPRKRPYQTILPSMLGRDGAHVASFGVVGGFMQPQGQVQLLRHLLERGGGAQRAVASPRWRILGGRRLGLEKGFDEAVARDLEHRGHEIEMLPPLDAGGAQLLMVGADGRDGASDPRGDGKVVFV